MLNLPADGTPFEKEILSPATELCSLLTARHSLEIITHSDQGGFTP